MALLTALIAVLGATIPPVSKELRSGYSDLHIRYIRTRSDYLVDLLVNNYGTKPGVIVGGVLKVIWESQPGSGSKDVDINLGVGDTEKTIIDSGRFGIVTLGAGGFIHGLDLKDEFRKHLMGNIENDKCAMSVTIRNYDSSKDGEIEPIPALKCQGISGLLKHVASYAEP